MEIHLIKRILIILFLLNCLKGEITFLLKSKCDMPTSTDPFDKSILPYIKTKEPLKCPNKFEYADLDIDTGIIYPNSTKINEKKCKCSWNALKIIIRSDDRNTFMFLTFQSFDSPINMNDLRKRKNSDLVLVRCYCDDGKMENLFSYPNFKIDNRREKASIQLDNTLDKVQINEKGIKKCPVSPNVIVLVIESLSFLNFKRHMKRTQKLFNNIFSDTLVEFESVIKIGENSYPNMISLITGQPRRNVVRRSYYDNYPLIWKDFEKKRGYFTAYYEDMPTFGLFNWIGRGFRVKNTDYFNRNFFCSINAFSSSGSMSSACWPLYQKCYNGRNYQDIQFDQMESFMKKMRNESYFIYAQPGTMTHGDFNMASVMDHHVERFIKRNTEALRNSVFLFLGDHGNRYGSQMRTSIARLESSWPYLAISVPSSVQHKYPKILSTLKQNSKQITTWIDVHSALNDLANCNLEPRPFSKQTNYSLFTELIPEDRTCDEALIPSSYCYCLPRQKLSIDSEESKIASEEFLRQLNRKLESSFRNKCTELKLFKIMEISKVYKEYYPNHKIYDIVLEASPSNAIFRGELTKLSDKEWSLNETTFERLNKYGNQGDCIKSNPVLQKACYCKIQTN